nr:NTF2-like N-terminal transpeptidase domain-containing protein [Candidatus Nitrosocosmicus franklandus]
MNTMNNEIEREFKTVRILGGGQFKIDLDTVKEINQIDNEMVSLLQNNENNETVKKEFDEKIRKIYDKINEKGIKIEFKEITASDIIIPGLDIDLKKARELFKGEGIIDDLY